MKRKVPLLDDLQDVLERRAPPGSVVEVVIMPAGAFDVTVRRSDGPVCVMQGSPARDEYGLTPDLRLEDAGFDDGHPIILHDYETAIRQLLRYAG